MTAKQRRLKQADFLEKCRDSVMTIDEIVKSLDVDASAVAEWLMEKGFRQRLHTIQKQLRRRRELQVDMGSVHAAAELTRTVTKDDPSANTVRRAACVDLIRLARDSKARRRATASAATFRLDETRALYHPEIAPDEAAELMALLGQPPAQTTDPERDESLTPESSGATSATHANDEINAPAPNDAPTQTQPDTPTEALTAQPG